MKDEQTKHFCRKLVSLSEDFSIGSDTGAALQMAAHIIRRLDAEVEKFAGYRSDSKYQRDEKESEKIAK
jgi:hypothetical protein